MAAVQRFGADCHRHPLSSPGNPAASRQLSAHLTSLDSGWRTKVWLVRSHWAEAISRDICCSRCSRLSTGCAGPSGPHWRPPRGSTGGFHDLLLKQRHDLF
jgi:hypothetical protein